MPDHGSEHTLVLQHIENVVRDHLSSIAQSLAALRDRVAPHISEEDLRHITTHHTVRARLASFPPLHRATIAAEAAYAAAIQVREHVKAATKSFTDSCDLAWQDQMVKQLEAEAHHWLSLAQQAVAAVASARRAIDNELERAVAGKATVVAPAAVLDPDQDHTKLPG
jgi:hypothetical protein